MNELNLDLNVGRLAISHPIGNVVIQKHFRVEQVYLSVKAPIESLKQRCLTERVVAKDNGDVLVAVN